MAWVTDSLRSVLGAVGQRIGLSSSTALPNVFTHQLAIAAYMCSGMMRKVIRIPAADRTQKWRDWQTDKETIALIEAEEKRLNLRAKVKHAEILRGVGGGALILITVGDHGEPLLPETIAKGGLVAVNVASRWEITAKDFDLDLASPTYGEPRMFSVSGNGRQHDIHPSRVICFRGDPVPNGTAIGTEEAFWGDSKLLQVYQAVSRSDNAKEWFAALVRKAKLLRIGIPDLDSMDETRLAKRIEVIALGESSLNATVYRSAAGTDDAGEKIDDYQVSWAGIPEMMDSFDQAIAAVSDIPFTRLTGRSPAGMNATGKHDMDNWHDAVRDGQETETRPCLEKLDPVLLRSAGVANPDKVWWEWAPLDSPTEKEKAETFKILVDAIEKLTLTGLVPEEAMARAVQNLLEERGDLPGLADALKLLSDDERFGLSRGEPDDTDPSEIVNGERGGDPGLAGRGGSGSGPARRAVADARFYDATPRTLYVRRDVVNVDDIKAWARSQGLPELQDGLHVTIAYSRTPLDWMKVDGEWNQDEKGQITVQPGGVRIVEPLGDRTAVLLFTSSALTWRHESIVRAGASHDYTDYQPHISLTDEPVDLSAVEPYRGKIILGPEIFEEVKHGGAPTGDHPFGDARRSKASRLARGVKASGFDPTQPRDRNGRWIPTGRRNFIDAAAKGSTNVGQVAIGTVGSKAKAALSGQGVRLKGDGVALDASMVRHIAVRHSTERGGQRSVTGTDIASASGLLNSARTIRLGNPAKNGSQRFIALTHSRGERLYSVFEVRKKAVTLVTMWKRG